MIFILNYVFCVSNLIVFVSLKNIFPRRIWVKIANWERDLVNVSYVRRKILKISIREGRSIICSYLCVIPTRWQCHFAAGLLRRCQRPDAPHPHTNLLIDRPFAVGRHGASVCSPRGPICWMMDIRHTRRHDVTFPINVNTPICSISPFRDPRADDRPSDCPVLVRCLVCFFHPQLLGVAVQASRFVITGFDRWNRCLSPARAAFD